MSSKKKILLIILLILISLQCLYVHIVYREIQGYGYFEYLYNSAKLNYNCQNNISNLQYMEDENLYLYDDANNLIRDYETNDVVLKVASGRGEFVVSNSYVFYIDSELYVLQYDINGNKLTEIQMPFETPYDDKVKLVYAENDCFYTIVRNTISVWDIKSGKVSNTIEGFTEYEKNEMGFVRSVKEDNYLIILGSNYDGNTYGGNYINTSGTVGDFNKSVICFVDLDQGKVVKEYVISNGEVVYMDDAKYATVHEGVVSFYNFDDGQKTREVAIKGYEMPADENDWYEYSFVCYDGKIIVSDWEGVIDEIPVG